MNTAALRSTSWDAHDFSREVENIVNSISTPDPYEMSFDISFETNQSGGSLVRQSANDYWEAVVDEGVNEGHFGRYIFGKSMGGLAQFGHNVKDMAIGLWSSQSSGFRGANKALINFGPEAFNSAANTFKTTLDGYSLIAESIGLGDFDGFRQSDAYNISLLTPYNNAGEAGGALIFGLASGYALNKVGGYGISINDVGARGLGGKQTGAISFTLLDPEEVRAVRAIRKSHIDLGEPTYITNKFPNEELDFRGKVFGEANVVNGKIPLNQGDTTFPREVDFVITGDNRLILGRKHTTLSNGEDVLAAGQLRLNGQGNVRRIDNLSGHFRPTITESSRYPQLFRDLGVDLTNTHFNAYKFLIDPRDNMVISESLIINEVLRK